MNLVIPKPEVSYLFIDGQYFWMMVDRLGKEVLRTPLVEVNFSRVAAPYTKVFYYDCEPPKRSGESNVEFQVREKQYEERSKMIQVCDGVHVHLGQTVSEGRKVKQKGVDVQIAVDMMTVAFRGDVRSLTLLSGDGDFAPLVNALVRMGLQVTVIADRPTASPMLMAAADRKRFIGFDRFRSWLSSGVGDAIPSLTVWGSKVPDHSRLIRSGVTSSGAWVEEYACKEDTMIVFDFRNAPLLQTETGAYMDFGRLWHRDRGLVIRVLEEFAGPVEWAQM